jgi:uncharacterized protein
MRLVILAKGLLAGSFLMTLHGHVFAQKNASLLLVHAQNAFISPSSVSIKGVLGDAISLSENGRMRSLPEWSNGRLIKMFSPEARLKNNTTDWYGEHAGKWMYSTALAVKRTGDKNLKAALFRTADYLVSTQEENGYLGSYSPELRFTNNESKLHKRSWDVWSHSYMILGFLEINRQFPNEKYLTAAKNIGELFLKTFGDGTTDITGYGTRYGYSATIALEPVVELYKATTDKRYLDFAELIVKKVEQREGLRMIASMLNNRDLETVADGKAYQIIWNLLGLAKLYQVTGNADYIKAIEAAWKNIMEHHLTITGGPWGGIGKHKECFNTKGYWNPYGYVETCSTMSWMQLNKILLEITGESKYAQEIEKSAYNALLGAQFSNGQDWSYHVFSNGKRHLANYDDCCPSSGVLALQELSPVVYSVKGNGIACNLFSESEATISLNNTPVNISQKTQYPFEGKVQLTVAASKPASFPLYIRIPEWAKGTTISVDGKQVTEPVVPGSYFVLQQKWGKQSNVEINFPFDLKMVEKAEHATIPQGTADIYRVNWFALTRGPLVYASNGLINGGDREKNFHLPVKEASQLFKPASFTGTTGPVYELSIPNEKPVTFLPYYEAGGRNLEGWRLTWMQFKID